MLRQSGAISPGIASDKEIIAAYEAMMKGQDAAALAALVRTYSTLDVDSTKLKNNDTPTLVIVGQKDAEKPSAAQLHSLMPKSRLHVIDGVNHFEAWTHAEFVKTVVEFLKDNEESK